jgi:hypothetical protein
VRRGARAGRIFSRAGWRGAVRGGARLPRVPGGPDRAKVSRASQGRAGPLDCRSAPVAAELHGAKITVDKFTLMHLDVLLSQLLYD